MSARAYASRLRDLAEFSRDIQQYPKDVETLQAAANYLDNFETERQLLIGALKKAREGYEHSNSGQKMFDMITAALKSAGAII